QNQSTTITATAVSGPLEPASFFVDDLPSGTTASFSLASCTPDCTTTLTLSTSTSTPAGSYVVNVTGIASYMFDGHLGIVVVESFFNLTVSSVNAPVLTNISVAPSSATLARGAMQQFTATGLDQFGAALASQPSFTWTVSGGGTISTAGLFTAGTTAGGPFTVTASNGGVNGTASVTVGNAAPTVATAAAASPNPVTGTTTNLRDRKSVV